MKKVIMMLLGIAMVTAVQAAAPSVKITTADGSSTGALVAKVDYMTPTAFKVVLSERPSPDNYPVRVSLNPQFYRGETPVELAETDPRDAGYIAVSTDDKIAPTDEDTLYSGKVVKEVEIPVGELETTFYVYPLGRSAKRRVGRRRRSRSDAQAPARPKMVCRVSVFVCLSGVLVLVGYHELVAVNFLPCVVPMAFPRKAPLHYKACNLHVTCNLR